MATPTPTTRSFYSTTAGQATMCDLFILVVFINPYTQLGKILLAILLLIFMLPRIADKKLPVPYHAFTKELARPFDGQNNINKLKMLKNFLDQEQYLNVWKSTSIGNEIQASKPSLTSLPNSRRHHNHKTASSERE